MRDLPAILSSLPAILAFHVRDQVSALPTPPFIPLDRLGNHFHWDGPCFPCHTRRCNVYIDNLNNIQGEKV